MSQVFLIDVQCLFFSLLFLYVGILAIRKSSRRLFLAAGFLFGVALLTKLFAVFLLVPLVLFYVHSRFKSRSQTSVGVALFFSSAAFVQYLWYEPISGRGFLSILNHDDFGQLLPAGFVPSPWFSLNFFREILSVFFILGLVFSMLYSVMQRKSLPKILVSDLILLASIAAVVGFNFYLVFGSNMLVPYVNSIKYDYLTLPFFCLLAASMAKKCSALADQKSAGEKRSSAAFYVAVFGLYMLLISMVVSLMTLNVMAKYTWLEFKVDGGLSYSFDRLTPFLDSGYNWIVQFFAFTPLQASLLWSIKDKLKTFLHRAFSNIASPSGEISQKASDPNLSVVSS